MTPGICLVVDQAVRAFLPALAFTLAWTHSIEKTAWEEDYAVDGAGLTIVEARVRGSGAGMEPPEGALLRDGAWHYRPSPPGRERLRLSVSDFAGDYTLCAAGDCAPLRARALVTGDAAVVEIAACAR